MNFYKHLTIALALSLFVTLGATTTYAKNVKPTNADSHANDAQTTTPTPTPIPTTTRKPVSPPLRVGLPYYSDQERTIYTSPGGTATSITVKNLATSPGRLVTNIYVYSWSTSTPIWSDLSEPGNFGLLPGSQRTYSLGADVNKVTVIGLTLPGEFLSW